MNGELLVLIHIDTMCGNLFEQYRQMNEMTGAQFGFIVTRR